MLLENAYQHKVKKSGKVSIPYQQVNKCYDFRKGFLERLIVVSIPYQQVNKCYINLTRRCAMQTQSFNPLSAGQ